MVANCGNLIVFRVSINFKLLGGKQSEGYGKLTLARITYYLIKSTDVHRLMLY